MAMQKQQKNTRIPLSLFYSYAHEDEDFRKRLETHLAQLHRQGLIAIWHDREILAGAEWGKEIDAHLSTASIILLLISPDFLASDRYDIEMQHALERSRREEARVIPIILRPCDWKLPPLDALQALPTNNKPVILWTNQDEAWLDVEQGIRKMVRTLLSLQTPSVPQVSPASSPVEILRRIRDDDLEPSWKAFYPAEERFLWRSIKYYYCLEDKRKTLSAISFLAACTFLILIGVTVATGSLVSCLVGFGILLTIGCVIGILSWRTANKSVLVITPDRFLWGNWKKGRLGKVFRYQDYRYLGPDFANEKQLLGIKVVHEVTFRKGKFVDLGKKSETDFIPLPSLFGSSQSLARAIRDVHRQFLRSNQGKSDSGS
jgi:hypothetical protein